MNLIVVQILQLMVIQCGHWLMILKNILNNINDEKYYGLGDYDIAEQFYAYLYPDEHITKEKSAYTDGWIGALLNKIQDEDDYQKLADSFADKNNQCINYSLMKKSMKCLKMQMIIIRKSKE